MHLTKIIWKSLNLVAPVKPILTTFRNPVDLQHIVYSNESFFKKYGILKALLWSFFLCQTGFWNCSNEPIIFAVSPKAPERTSSAPSGRLSAAWPRWAGLAEGSWAATWWGCGRGEMDCNQTGRRRNTKHSPGLWGSHIQSTTNNERGNTFFSRTSHAAPCL